MIFKRIILIIIFICFLSVMLPGTDTDISYKSVDVAEDLQPEVVGSVTKLPFPDKSFDVVVAFEVLEHLPFEKFEVAVSEISRVCYS